MIALLCQKKVKSLRRHDGSLCIQKQPQTAAPKATIKKNDLLNPHQIGIQ